MQCVIEGDIRCGGTYLLHIRLGVPCQLVFGAFRRGAPVGFPAGDYLYIGSALARRGSTSLAHRLLRHATRSGNRPPHTLRAVLLAELQAAGVPAIRPPATKTLRWHVDYLLDDERASLAAVYVLGDGVALERALAAHLAADPLVWIPAPGLGASDDHGATHLLGVPDNADWWQKIAIKLARMTNGGLAMAECASSDAHGGAEQGSVYASN